MVTKSNDQAGEGILGFQRGPIEFDTLTAYA